MRTLSFAEVECVAGGDGPSFNVGGINFSEASLGASLFAVGLGIVVASGIAGATVTLPVVASIAGVVGLTASAGGGALFGDSMMGVQSWLAKEAGSH